MEGKLPRCIIAKILEDCIEDGITSEFIIFCCGNTYGRPLVEKYRNLFVQKLNERFPSNSRGTMHCPYPFSMKSLFHKISMKGIENVQFDWVEKYEKYHCSSCNKHHPLTVSKMKSLTFCYICKNFACCWVFSPENSYEACLECLNNSLFRVI